jgi:formylglycine-generating enzyme required for sulfatase activity
VERGEKTVVPRTEIVVSVHTDIVASAPDALRALKVTVRAGDARGPVRWQSVQPLAAARDGATDDTFLMRFGLLPLDNDASRVAWVEVAGCRAVDCAQVAVAQRVTVSFVPQETRFLRLDLTRACFDDCLDPSLTCAAYRGMCMEVPRIDPRQLPQTEGGLDAGAISPDALAQRSCTTADASGCGVAVIAGATFTLGDPLATRAAPVIPGVRVSRFAVDRYEVTVARFRAYWNPPANHPPVLDQRLTYPSNRWLAWNPPAGSLTIGTAAGCNWTPAPGPNELAPMNCVSWYLAQSFCVWDGGRLPTESEWELTARGASSRPYAWGDAAPDASRLCASIEGRPLAAACRVGGFTPGATPEGVFDLAGNVREMTADAYEDFTARGGGCWGATVASPDPLCQPIRGEMRTLRGSSWEDAVLAEHRAASRAPADGTLASPGVGFRCARSL